ncbi:MAG: hypothetical protein ACLPY5_08415 [Candidatus Bathyarchaeia archaeon]
MRKTTVGFVSAGIVALMYVAFGMSYADTWYQFQQDYLSNLNQSTLTQRITQSVVAFLMQPVFVGPTFSLPLGIVLLGVVGIVLIATKRRRHY